MDLFCWTPAFWAFLWFVGFCYLANQWQVSKPKDNPLNEGTDAARAAIAFSFFSIFTWVSSHLPSQGPGCSLQSASTAGAPSCLVLLPAGLPLPPPVQRTVTGRWQTLASFRAPATVAGWALSLLCNRRQP